MLVRDTDKRIQESRTTQAGQGYISLGQQHVEYKPQAGALKQGLPITTPSCNPSISAAGTLLCPPMLRLQSRGGLRY
jgi:hypothetical protein